MVSVLILTYNEEANLAGCLESVLFSDDVVVLDSGSQDKTIAIAESFGAKVLYRAFDNYAAQRNFGLSIGYKNEWVLMVDADERVTPELLAEIQCLMSEPSNPISLYRVRRKDIFMGKWLRRSSGYPTWFGRLFRKGQVRVEREINEEYYTGGEVGTLQGHLLHYPFNKGVAHWLARHNRYSSMEAKCLLDEVLGGIPWSGFLSSDPMLNRIAFKQFAYRMPFRPAMTFVYLYLVRLGFLDGRPGFHFACMRAVYEYMINLKLNELKRKENGMPV